MKKILFTSMLVVCLLSIESSAAGPWTTTGDITTEAFSVSSGVCKILWDVSASDRGIAHISIHVYDKADNSIVEMASAETAGRGQTIMHRVGQFYLSISVTGKAKVWTE